MSTRGDLLQLFFTAWGGMGADRRVAYLRGTMEYDDEDLGEAARHLAYSWERPSPPPLAVLRRECERQCRTRLGREAGLRSREQGIEECRALMQACNDDPESWTRFSEPLERHLAGLYRQLKEGHGYEPYVASRPSR